MGWIRAMIENKPSSLLRQIDLYPGIIDTEGILQPGKVGSDKLWLMGKRKGRPVEIKGVNQELEMVIPCPFCDMPPRVTKGEGSSWV